MILRREKENESKTVDIFLLYISVLIQKNITLESYYDAEKELYHQFLSGNRIATDESENEYYITDLLEFNEGIYAYYDIIGDEKEELHINNYI